MEDRGIRRDYTHLMKASASVEDHENFHDFTPLMDAAQKGHYFLVRHLLEIGSNVNDQTKTGHTALTYASWNGHTHIANLLMQFGAARDNSTMLLPQAQESAASALMLLPQHQQQQTTQPKNKDNNNRAPNRRTKNNNNSNST
ncbi:ankyrin repeat and KH domain-containing protein 1-like [Formica exsecta]|uniref:ankyrin repeat and KH domain-containing protein 1-like n=1 Tax=Formica exsecta TaxID=72781 RepID=UPI001144C24E|nr:ankyrin repeat and KH domain-containing protein 1-like [Formica exsecta]